MEGSLKGKGTACIRAAGRLIQTEAKLLKDWLIADRWKWIALACVFVMVYASWMFSCNPRVDSESVINNPYTTAGWLGIGRQGGILTEYVFGIRWFNPLFCNAMGYTVFFLSGLLIAYLFVRIGKVSNNAALLFALLYESAPIFTEIFYFDMMIFKVAFAALLCVLAVGMDFCGIIKKNWTLRIVAGLAMIWTFSTYQAFVPLYIGITAACYVLRGRKEKEHPVSPRLLISLIVDFLAAFMINAVITKVFFSAGSYFDLQNMWLMLPFWLCVRHIAGHIVRACFGLKAFYSVFYAIFAVWAIAAAYMEGRKAGWKKAERWLYLLLIAGIQMIPFMMTVVLGGEPAIRTQMAYPFILAFDAMLCLSMTQSKPMLRRIVCLLAVIAVFSQAKTTMRFVYTDNIRAQEDIQLTWNLFSRIGEETEGGKPLIFVGERESKLNGACLRGEVIGGSFYKWDAGAEPRYTRSSMRITELAKTQGFDYAWVSSKEDAEQARRLAVDMPVYPREGCIKETDRFIIVKIGEDLWFDELK